MEKIKFEELLKEKELQKIIYMHIHNKISLTDSQLDKVLKLKYEKQKREWGRD